jgi:hypothetical protein
MNYPSIPGEMEQLERYRDANGLTAAVLATAMSAFGWTWNTDHVADLMAGRVKTTSNERVFIRKFLLKEYYDVNATAV